MTLHQKYKKYDNREHVLHRPGMYIGSVEKDKYNTWVAKHVNSGEEGSGDVVFEKRVVESVPGLYKIFDEILVNAIDHVTRLKMMAAADPSKEILPVKNIKITVEKATGVFSVFNDGDGIEIAEHPEHHVYIPELIFGNMLTSTNYDDSEEKIIGGQNGIGAKACNIFSKSFVLETVDHRRKKIYTQEFTDNMSKKTTPVIKYCAKKPYTIITFKPDYERFGLAEGLTDDIYDLFIRRCYDVCALTDNDIHVWLNGKKLEIKNFEKYVDMYLGDKASRFRAYEKINDRWEVVAACTTDPGFEQVSFVNGIWTVNGGKHVEYIAGQVCSKLCDMFAAKRKKEGLDVKPQHIKNNLMLFVKSVITNPTFDSQSKECLTTPASKFGGGKAEVSDKFIEKLYKSELADRVLSMCDANAAKSLKKTDGKKTSRVMVPNLDDANLAGTKDSAECTLILTEGLSARTMAISGLSVVGRDRYGVFPLRGKILNVKDAQLKKIQDNEELTNLKKILGLEHGKEYKDVSELRYGKIMVMSDQDQDGSHIRGLLFNVFQSLWPSLYKLDGFMTSMLTPIIKAIHSRDGVMQFYSIVDFENWKKVMESSGDDGLRGWKIKYYKGLGTSTEKEAKEYFEEMKRVTYKYGTKTSDEALDLAFNKKRADDRKEWLMRYNRDAILDYTKMEVSYEEFVHNELIHFSNADLERSINHLCDGLKVSTRKILYGCFKRKLWRDELKVAQLAAYIAEVSAYHHGEASLQQAIIGMAQQFVGANNANLLVPNGQFGTRCSGGQDAASPRYIFTLLSKLARAAFKDEDAAVLKYLDDDGVIVEPEYYIPVVPMILINGGLGIGTGFSTNMPCHNPEEVVAQCKRVACELLEKIGGDINSETQMGVVESVINDMELGQMHPWYIGFKGEISPHKDGVYISKGRYKWVSDTVVEVTELPIGTWTDDYKEFLIEMCNGGSNGKSPYLKDFESYYTAKNVNFKLKLAPGVRAELEPKFETEFKLTSTKNLSLNNIHLFSANGAIKKYKDTSEVLKAWAVVRVRKYLERKEHQLKEMKHVHKYLSAKVRFIQEIIDGVVVLSNKKLAEVESQLRARDYPMDGSGNEDEGGYAYLTRMPLYQLTAEKKAALEAEAGALARKIEDLAKKSIQAIWLEELAEFETAWKEHRAAIEAEYDEDVKPKAGVAKGKKRAAPKK